MVRTIGARDKIRRKYVQSFARQYLEDHKIQMYCGEEQILKPLGYPLYDIKLPNTRYYIGDQFIDVGELKKIYKFEELRSMGFVIISEDITDSTRWEQGQKVIYLLRKFDETGKNLNNIPIDHYVEYDSYNKTIRLVGNRAGPNGFGYWVSLDNKDKAREGAGRKINIENYSKNVGKMMKDRMNKLMNIEEDPTPIYIREAAFMVTDANEIVCFPNTPDMPSILITGQKGTGKSFCLHSLVDRFFWKPGFNYKIVIMNDSSRETGTWCFPNKDEAQRKILKRLNERPLPLPCVYLHPMVEEDYEKLYMEDVGFDITIPFKEVVSNHKDYLNLKDSTIYFTKIKDEILDCETEDQVQSILDGLTFNQVPPQSANKIRAVFDTLLASKMTDISTENQNPWVTSKNPDKSYNPLTACAHAGVLPILQTEYVSNERERLSIYFSYFGKDLFIRQKQDRDFLKEKSELLLVLDECLTAKTMISTENGPKTIKSLYVLYKQDKPLPRVRTFNSATNKFELKRIIKPLRKENEELLEINVGVSKIKCTPNHKIHTLKGWKHAKELKEGDLLSAYYRKDMKNLMRNFNDDQLQIVYGSFLGDGGLHFLPSGNYRIRLTHGIKQLKYLNFKKKILNIKKRKVIMSGYTGRKDIYCCQTRMFNLPDKFEDIKEIPDWLINKIDARGVAIWFLDDGSLAVRKGIVMGSRIHSNSFDYNNNLKLQKKLHDDFNIVCRITKVRKYYELILNQENTNKLIELIKIYVPECMNYKINHVSSKKYNWSDKRLDTGYALVKSIKQIKNKFNPNSWRQSKPYVYDLMVEDNHNYIVCTNTTENGILVHNCHNISQRGIKSKADMLLRRCVREGRPRRIGTLLATQKFDELPAVIQGNSTYLLCFLNPSEATQIANQYNLGKARALQIKDLGKHEVLAYTTEHFVIYDSNGKRRKSKINEVFKGKTLPPYSDHKRPTVTKK